MGLLLFFLPVSTAKGMYISIPIIKNHIQLIYIYCEREKYISRPWLESSRFSSDSRRSAAGLCPVPDAAYELLLTEKGEHGEDIVKYY